MEEYKEWFAYLELSLAPVLPIEDEPVQDEQKEWPG